MPHDGKEVDVMDARQRCRAADSDRRHRGCESHFLTAVVRRIDHDLCALSSSKADFPFELGRLVAEIVGDHAGCSADERIWWDEGRNLITCILSHLVCSPHEVDPHNRLLTLRSSLIKPSRAIQAKLARIANESLSILARVLALELLGYESAGKFAAIRATAIEQSYWLFRADGSGIEPAA